MKVLLSAYACEPGRGSEPGVGWNTAKEIARRHQVWVLTSHTHRSAIEAELSQNPIPNLYFIYLDPFGWVYDWSKEGKRAHWDVHLHYYCWQIYAYFTAKRWHSIINFDLVHHVTYVKYSSPSFVSLLPIPFIWGPVGGGETAPVAFWHDFSLRAKVYEIVRMVAHRLGEYDPFVRMTARRSQVAWATTNDTAIRLRKMGAALVEVGSESGLCQPEIEQLGQWSPLEGEPMRFISMARLLHWKGLHLGIRAFAQAKLPDDTEYWIFGEGPEQKHLQALSHQLRLGNRVKFWGRLAREESLAKLGKCQVLVHPSLHDSGGWVCLEAMAAGRPVICLDLGGPGVQVTAATGFKIPALDPEQVVHDMAEAMTKLAANSELRQQMGQAGQHRVREAYSWSRKAEHLAEVYRRSLRWPA
ncbi:glycosyltransferase [Leptolyngbya sp. NK1-12]|uniref:Glycosyltransferase n=1 Tax=Leptolyngbya sp. NK1-12 TaxID=2547451 RepID=A0AA97APM0_9CYAN|nr:glycosyltransferase [Leptolyngbya sp. NK1-12]